VAVHVFVVDALNARAVDCYRRFGFIALPSRSKTLFLPLDSFLDLTNGRAPDSLCFVVCP
jgi:hypothetical protein